MNEFKYLWILRFQMKVISFTYSGGLKYSVSIHNQTNSRICADPPAQQLRTP